MLQKWINRLKDSLTVRVFFITASMLVAACGLTYAFIVWAAPISFSSIMFGDLEQRAERLSDELSLTTLEDSGPLIDRFTLETGAEVMLADHQGVGLLQTPAQVLGETEENREDISITVSAAVSSVETVDPQNNGMMQLRQSSVSYPVVFRNSSELYTLTVWSGVKAVNQTKQAVAQVSPYLTLVVLAISTLGALLYSRHITRPIVRLSSISQKMAGLNFSGRCKESRRDEIGVLGRNLDELSDRLSSALAEVQNANTLLRRELDRKQRLDKQRTAFFSAASHELKTPLTVLKGQLSGMLAGIDIYKDRDKYLLRSLAVSNRMESLVGEMLAVARLDNAEAAWKQDRIDLSVLVRAQAGQIADLAEQKGQTLDIAIVPGLISSGDEAMLNTAIANLLSNAVFYSPRGAAISVSLQSDGKRQVLTIINSRSSIPEEDLPHLFEAFYRVESSRNRESGGSGLGLYLVKMILDRHGASCEIRNEDNHVRATVIFPPALHTNSI